eukprot:TRINITY_DN8425_c0_g1_i4.p1 TRINITY_DN8425_c0_g1~~TRINITY_DN8425_c0_g1_i4.p1  ORF type:complete len:221 (-),score=31.02 TRINITY_DN8425_c0_g1_i4:570-1232(-)
MEEHSIPRAEPASETPNSEQDDNPPLAEPESSMWSMFGTSFTAVQSAAKDAAQAGTAALSEQWAGTAESRARIACNVSATLGDAKQTATTKMQKARLFGQRPPTAVFGLPLTTISTAPEFLEAVANHVEAQAVTRMFRPSSEEAAADACSVAAELQMMVDEGEPLDLQGISPLMCVSLVASYLWSLPWALLPSTRLLNAVAAEPEAVTAETIGLARSSAS